MTIKYADRVRETSLSTGTGDLTLAGVAAGYRLINTVFNNDFDATGLDFDYVITHVTNNTFEVGTGKLLTSTSMQRTSVAINSDETTAFINFASGGLIITITPARDTLANLEVINLITDLISEATAGTGVTIDGVLLKDADINAAKISLTGHLIRKITSGITAGSTQTQAGATLLTSDINGVTTVGTNGDVVKLPLGVGSSPMIVIHNNTANTLQVFPNTGGFINGGSVDAVDPSQIPAESARVYYDNTGSGDWKSLLFTV